MNESESVKEQEVFPHTAAISNYALTPGPSLAMRPIEALSPNDLQVGNLKKSAALALSVLIAGSTVDELQRRRNLSLKGFGEARNPVVKALVAWIEKNSSKGIFTRSPAAELVTSSIKDSSGVLFEAVRDSCSHASNSSDLAEPAWRLWLSSRALKISQIRID